MKLFYPRLTLATLTLLQSNSFACEDLIEISQSDLQALLPPSPIWNDTKSVRDFVVLDSDLTTPAEFSNFQETATYEQVTDFFIHLAEDSPYVQLSSIAKLANGEDVWLVIVSGEEQFDSKDMVNPVVYATAGIHPGESSGVNAGMMFIRNLVTKEEYKSILGSINFLFVPIMNVQGYLRQSPSSRINQYGPNTSGRRANGSWKNLNRDFAKLDTPEVRAVVGVMRDFDVSFYTDMHSTDGMNYQPDVTWCDNGDAGLSNEIYAWLRTEMQPELQTFLEEEYNHITGVCYDANDPMDPTAGYYPYFSDGATY
ncbi:zinc carboxypeptidase [Nitzschia inconspicua]|uniref:Zinc carboxypeptidase n=1 Tax=Nitzschia inconspicua TaxID=303405 RepID=A0A9K3PJ74_9STRA|nr:zinc carboxypeptidase [Nitzschia inconspicua]